MVVLPTPPFMLITEMARFSAKSYPSLVGATLSGVPRDGGCSRSVNYLATLLGLPVVAAQTQTNR